MNRRTCISCGLRGGSTDGGCLMKYWQSCDMERSGWRPEGSPWLDREESVAQEVSRTGATSHNMTYVHSWKSLITNALCHIFIIIEKKWCHIWWRKYRGSRGRVGEGRVLGGVDLGRGCPEIGQL